ncbi:MAG: TVP38/TMEM64 family protein [Parvibaculaceae bacterium]|nr:TVP38/TMEM64 family protein [Parvibaculaceae bacterium]
MTKDTETKMPAPEKAGGGFSLARLTPILVLIAGLGAFFWFDLDAYLSLEVLRENRAGLGVWVAENAVLAAVVYILIYTVLVALSVPGALVATLTGGLLFGTVFGGLYTVIGATAGATIIFLAAKTALGDMLRAKASGAILKMEEGFRENAFSYMMVLRLVPAFPFFLVNLAPAFLGVKLRTYVVATFLGIIPGTFVFASVGNGLGALFEKGQDPDLGIIFAPEILLPIIGLALLSLLPVAYKRFTNKKDPAA